MGRKSIRIQKPSNDGDGIMELDLTKHDPSAANAALAILGKHLGLFTERAEVKLDTKSDVTDPQVKLQIAREVLFLIARAEHAVKNAPKMIEGKLQTT